MFRLTVNLTPYLTLLSELSKYMLAMEQGQRRRRMTNGLLGPQWA